MAYMNQEKKAKIASALKTVIPADWKYTLSVRHHSSLVLTIKSAPIDLLTEEAKVRADVREYEMYGNLNCSRTYLNLNHYHLDRHFQGHLLEIFTKIKSVMNIDNWDHSDSMTDHFDVGHYIDINIGRWDRSFVCTAPQMEAA